MKAAQGWKWMVAGIMAASLSHCTSAPAPKDNKPPTPITDPVKPTPADVRTVGRHCFEGKESNLHIDGSLELKEGNAVEGFLKGQIVEAGDGGEGMWDASFRGRLEGDSLRLTVLSNESGTKGEQQVVWVWRGGQLQAGAHLLSTATCAQ